MTGLSLQVVTPNGTALTRAALTSVVLRRTEDEHDPGSEVGILPGHAPMLVRVAPCALRYRDRAGVFSLSVGQGYAEVWGDTVTVVVDVAGMTAQTAPSGLASQDRARA